jgi:hypothetical protein
MQFDGQYGPAGGIAIIANPKVIMVAIATKRDA